MKKNPFNLHNLLMLACMIPMIGALLYFTGGDLSVKGSGSSSLFLLMVIICPLMHFFMMRGMNHGKSCDHEAKEEKDVDKAV